MSPQHLVLVIQAVDAKIDELEGELASLPAGEGSELESLLLSYVNAAAALEREYREVLAQFSNFPPYESLVKNQP